MRHVQAKNSVPVRPWVRKWMVVAAYWMTLPACLIANFRLTWRVSVDEIRDDIASFDFGGDGQ